MYTTRCASAKMEEDFFKIYVAVFLKKVVALDVRPSTTVGQVMQQLGDFPDASGDYLLLFHDQDLNSSPLSDVACWGVRDQDQLILTRRGLFNVRVQAGFGFHSEIIPSGMIQVEMFDRVADMKLKIWKKLGIPVEKQLLFYCYSPMVDDERKLAFYGFFNPWETDEEIDRDYCFLVNVLTEPPCDRCHGASVAHREGCRGSSLEQLLVSDDPGSSSDCTMQPLPVSDRQGSSSDCTIVVEIPASIGTISHRLKVNLNDTISKVKTMIDAKAHSHDADSPLAFISEELFVLLFNRKVLKDETLTLEECGIKDQDRLMICPKGDYTVTIVLVLVEVPDEMQVHGVTVRFYDTVSALKRRIRRIVKISSKKQILLRFEGRRLDDDDRCLLEYGIVQYPHIPGLGSYYLHKRGTCIIEALTYGPLDAAGD